MSEHRDLFRRLAEYYAGEAPSRAPDWVLRDSLAAIETTKQPRLFIGARRRFYLMSTNLKVAAAVVAVVVLGVGAWQLLPGPSGPGGQPSPTPSVTPSVEPSASPVPTAPPLTGTHISAMYGLTLSYPAGWSVTEGTEPWTLRSFAGFGSPLETADLVHLNGAMNLFIIVTSQSLDGESGPAWADAVTAEHEEGLCPTFDTVVVGGLDGRLYSCNEPLRALFWSDNRGYLVGLYRSSDEAWVLDVYDLAWFNGLLETVELQ
jgi:hypothetical protein